MDATIGQMPAQKPKFKEVNKLATEALAMIIERWNAALSVCEATSPESKPDVVEALGAATIASSKILLTMIDGGTDGNADQYDAEKWNRLNAEADAHARLHVETLHRGRCFPDPAFPRLQKKDAAPYWFVDDPFEVWPLRGDGRNLRMIEGMAMTTIMNLHGVRERSGNGDICQIAHVIALVSASKLLLLGLPAEQAGILERSANQAAHKLMKVVAGIGGTG